MAEWKVLIDYLGGKDAAGRVLKDPMGLGGEIFNSGDAIPLRWVQD